MFFSFRTALDLFSHGAEDVILFCLFFRRETHPLAVFSRLLTMEPPSVFDGRQRVPNLPLASFLLFFFFSSSSRCLFLFLIGRQAFRDPSFFFLSPHRDSARPMNVSTGVCGGSFYDRSPLFCVTDRSCPSLSFFFLIFPSPVVVFLRSTCLKASVSASSGLARTYFFR